MSLSAALLKILCRPLIVPTSLKVHRKLGGDFPGALAIERFLLLAYPSVKLNAPRRG
jgi:hypothetical protein